MEQSQYLFIHTSKCEGAPYKFSFTVPQNTVRCDSKTERMRVSLVKWTCRHDWTVVREGNNTFTVQYGETTTTITIPNGNYTYTEYATKIQTLMNAQRIALGVTTGVIIVEWLAPQNHLKITFPNPLTRTFTFPALYLSNYGMSSAVYTITNTILESDVPIDFYKNQERLYIYCEGLHPHSTHRNLMHSDNTVSEMEGQKNLLASVLVNNYPYETIVWENDGAIYGHFLQDNHLYGRLNFVIKTITGVEADFLTESHLVLKIDKIPNHKAIKEEANKTQEEIRDYLKYMFLSQNIPSDLPNEMIQNPA